MRKLLAFILLQSYLSVAFGVSLMQVTCCDVLTTSNEVACHVPTPTNPVSESDDCSVCLLTQNPEHTEDCCPDCEELVVSVKEDGFSTEPITTNSTSIDLKNMQAAVILLPWLLEYAPDAHLQTIKPEASSPLLDRAAPVPLFIWNCVYRT